MLGSLGWTVFMIVASLAGVGGTPQPAAAAHICMDAPLSRVGPECVRRSPQKIGSCGVAGRSEHVSVYRPGETITVKIRETVDHPSHYRVAFNVDGDAFPDPASVDDKSGSHPTILLDGIEDVAEAEQEVRVTLPRVKCERCTLQLIQVMYDKLGNGFGGNRGGEPGDNNDMYYSCADIALRGEPVDEAGAAAPAPARVPSRLPGAGALALVAVAGVIGYRRTRP